MVIDWSGFKNTNSTKSDELSSSPGCTLCLCLPLQRGSHLYRNQADLRTVSLSIIFIVATTAKFKVKLYLLSFIKWLYVCRNLSWGKQTARQAMRECRGLVDSLMSYIQSCVAEENPDDKVNCLVSIDTTFIQHYGQKSRQQKTSSYKYTLPWMYCRVHLMCVYEHVCMNREMLQVRARRRVYI